MPLVGFLASMNCQSTRRRPTFPERKVDAAGMVIADFVCMESDDGGLEGGERREEQVQAGFRLTHAATVGLHPIS